VRQNRAGEAKYTFEQLRCVAAGTNDNSVAAFIDHFSLNSDARYDSFLSAEDVQIFHFRAELQLEVRPPDQSMDQLFLEFLSLDNVRVLFDRQINGSLVLAILRQISEDFVTDCL